MRTPAHSSGREQGAALIVTLIVCVVLATVVVALIQSTTRDRYSSASVAGYYRAQLAADSGLAVASAVLDTQMANDHFIVVANMNTRQLFVGTASNATPPGTVAYRPAFSFSTSLSNVVTTNAESANTVRTNVLPSYTVAAPSTNFTITNMPGAGTIVSPQVVWIYLTNTFTNASGGSIVQTNARFAFWIEDLGGKLDLSVAGVSSATDTNTRRPTGTNPAELALWSMFSPAANSNSPANVANTLVAARPRLVTPATARLVSPAVTANQLASMTLGLRHDTNEPEIIPFGFGYADEGRPKYNLNTNISAAGVGAIASIINANLPQFIQRAGGYTNPAGGGATNAAAYAAQSYLQTLAANIVDYADANSDPTTDGTPLSTNRVRPVYRGVDSYPFVNEVSKRWVMTEHAITNLGSVQGRGIKIETTDFFELWNPSSQTNNGSLTFVSVHQQTGSAGFGSFSFANPVWASNSSGAVSNGVTTNVFAVSGLRPNGFVVFACPTVTNFFFFPATNSNAVVLDREVNTSRYYTAWSGIFADAVLGGLYRAGPFSAAGLALNRPTNRANLPAFIYQNALATTNADPAVGDPRMTIYLSLPVDATAYVNNTSFGGRNVRASIATTNAYAEVSPQSWPDSGHNSAAGAAAGSELTLPTAVPLAAYSNLPPSRISDAGSFSNVFELGAIFDPIQWTDTTGLPTGWRGKWTNLTTNAVGTNGYGGGNSLRIGRAEHQRFTNNGFRASQLLDLFTAGPAGSGAVSTRVPGRINLNSADTNALRALAAGVYHTSDPALVAGGTNFVIPATAVDAFVSAVTNRLAQGPFLSVADLAVMTNNNPGAGGWPATAVFGNRSIAGVSAWNDAAAEEWLSKVFPLATVRSRNFLVYAVGQSLNPWQTNQPIDARVSATSTKVFQVYVQPLRNSAGLATNCVVRVLWSREL